jgi:hypothetical protein
VALDKTHQGLLRDPQAATELNNGVGILVFLGDLMGDLMGLGLADREYVLDVLRSTHIFSLLLSSMRLLLLVFTLAVT